MSRETPGGVLHSVSIYFVTPLLSLTSSCVIGLTDCPVLSVCAIIDAVAANASMCPTANGPAGHQLEKSPNGPPKIEVSSPEDAPDAGLRSLDHCMYLFNLY